MKEQKKRDRTQNSQEHLKGEVEKKNRETNKYMRENKMLERRNTELRVKNNRSSLLTPAYVAHNRTAHFAPKLAGSI
eukprot:3629157-Pyramimonas_sp.AAC.1